MVCKREKAHLGLFLVELFRQTQRNMAIIISNDLARFYYLVRFLASQGFAWYYRIIKM